MVRSSVNVSAPPYLGEHGADEFLVNVALLFGLPRYREVAGAHLEGLERRAQRGASLARITWDGLFLVIAVLQYHCSPPRIGSPTGKH